MKYEYNFSDSLVDPWQVDDGKGEDKDQLYWANLGLVVVVTFSQVTYKYLFRKKRE